MGGANCAIVHCPAQKSKHKGLSFHKVPAKGVKDEWRRQLLIKINRQKKFNPDTAHICSRHFSESCFITGAAGRRRLIEGSLPTQYMPVRSVETPKPVERKPPLQHFVDGAPSKEYPDPLPASCSSETSQSTYTTPKAKQSCPSPRDRSTSCNNQPPKKRLRKTLAYCEALTQSRRTVTHKNQQRPSRRRRAHSRSKSLSQDSDQTEAGGRSNSQQESPESKQMSAVKIEIDVADDPAQLWMRESSSQVSGHCRSAVPHVQVMKTEPDGEYNCHSAQCQEAVTEELASHEYSMDVKQEKDRDLFSCNQELSTEQLHAFELGTEIKQEIDMSSCSHSEDISTKQYLAGELGMEIKHEKNLDVHQDNSQCHESELCTRIKQEKDTDVGFACESFIISEQFQACDYKVDTEIKQEKDMGYAEAFSSEQYYSSNFGIEIKQEVDLDGS